MKKSPWRGAGHATRRQVEETPNDACPARILLVDYAPSARRSAAHHRRTQQPINPEPKPIAFRKSPFAQTMTRYKTMGISSFLSVPDKAAKRFHPAIRRSAWTRLALVGALFTASHARANETRQVVSSNGTTNTVERIDFPVGDIKDIIPAGDKYIIHANPIDSLKDSVAVDALFVMEKANPNAAFGRTFSTPIHSVVYVPGLDMATWSYENSTLCTDTLELKNGRSSLQAAASTTNFIVPSRLQSIYPRAELLPSTSNTLWEIGQYSSKQHVFIHSNGEYQENIVGGTAVAMARPLADGLVAGNEDSTFVLRSAADPTTFIYNQFDGRREIYDLPNMGKPTSMAAVSVNPEQHEGHVFLGYENGEMRSANYTANHLDDFGNAQSVLPGAVNSMAATANQTVKAVSTNSNIVVEITPSLGAEDTIIPSNAEIGYRKVITDGNDTLLLSNTHSNYFYRVRKTR